MSREKSGAITMLFKDDGVTIEIRDTKSTKLFVEATLNAKEACQMLSRLANTPCELKTQHLEKVGKKMEMDTLEFEVKDSIYESRINTAVKQAKQACPSGWEPDENFSSQGSFFTKDGKEYARTTIRRWV